ncbi:MAG: acyloxyacyl hydrolase [Flavobacteriales bacterium]|nr:hypothetical protein [Flavobacteriales bacterium]MCC6577389.1 acyloxyacyl hydrolase [Flavobacteriales bacterium]NUQ15857.1 acyloxyacyl hydrolase [Flavobacteriales bacterium]
MCRRERWWALVAVLPLLLQVAVAQSWSVGLRGHYGFLWPHRPSSWVLVEGHAVATELFAERRLPGDRPWQRHYRAPSFGVGLLYTGLANPGRIGATARVLPYLQLPFVRGRHGDLGMRLGWGLGYVTHPYDRRGNFKQIAIGSRLNTAIQLMVAYNHWFGRTGLSAGFGIDHWSNGSFALPNLGLNLLSASLGVVRSLGPVTPYVHVPDTAALERPRREQSVVGAMFWSETGRPESGRHSVYSLIGQVQWRLSRKSAVAVGADVFNKGALRTDHPELEDRGRAALTQAGLHAGYALLFGRGELFLQMGAYVYTPVPDEASVFHRLGGRYRIARHLVAHLALKSHYAVADHWEFGIGYRWS